MNKDHIGTEMSEKDKERFLELFGRMEDDPNVDTRRIRVREELYNLQNLEKESGFRNKK